MSGGMEAAAANEKRKRLEEKKGQVDCLWMGQGVDGCRDYPDKCDDCRHNSRSKPSFYKSR